jgi:Amt family ammonium transporter
MVWIGWYGFNSGWAAVTQAAAQAFTSTTIAGLVAAFAWVTADQTSSGKASNFGAFAGIVAGLAAITPAAGFVSPTGAIIIGLCAGLIPGATRLFFRFWGRSDQTIEAVGVHLLGGLIGMFMAGILATPPEANPALASAVEVTRLNGLDKLLNSGGLWVEQLKAIVVTLSLSGSASALIAISLRAAQEAPAFRSLFHHPAAAHLK